jgi:hypothetical protein
MLTSARAPDNQSVITAKVDDRLDLLRSDRLLLFASLHELYTNEQTLAAYIADPGMVHQRAKPIDQILSHLGGSFDGVLLEQNLDIAQRHCCGGGVSAIGVYLRHLPVFRGSP